MCYVTRCLYYMCLSGVGFLQNNFMKFFYYFFNLLLLCILYFSWWLSVCVTVACYVSCQFVNSTSHHIKHLTVFSLQMICGHIKLTITFSTFDNNLYKRKIHHAHKVGLCQQPAVTFRGCRLVSMNAVQSTKRLNLCQIAKQLKCSYSRGKVDGRGKVNGRGKVDARDCLTLPKNDETFMAISANVPKANISQQPW